MQECVSKKDLNIENFKKKKKKKLILDLGMRPKKYLGYDHQSVLEGRKMRRRGEEKVGRQV
jgi:hypothetical protein